MACGAPVVCSNTSSLPEIAGDAALLVDPLDTERDRGRAAPGAEPSPALAAELRRTRLRQAAKFSWERAARETVGVYERLLRAGHRSTRMPNFVLDARTATPHYPGIGRYVRSLATALASRNLPAESG